MSRLYEALRRMESEKRSTTEVSSPIPASPSELLNTSLGTEFDLRTVGSVNIEPLPNSRLVAVTEPRSLGAEKFRSLATRLIHLRRERELKSLQITSSIIGEGKTLVSANLALTLALECGEKVLLVEGDLHRPSLGSRLGLSEIKGINQWWDGRDQPITQYINRVNNWPLWFLGAGGACERPSHILQSGRFSESFLSLNGAFDWIIVDSTPMLPTVDANLWSRLVDGTILVVREGVALVNALKKGLQALDNPKLVGIVLNEASEFDRGNYEDQYYALQDSKIRVVESR
jgi:capsular exopolysaccharide synthesis family protein